MEDKTYYGILMNRIFLNSNLYLFKPVSVIKGIFEENEAGKFFIDSLGASYYLSSDVNGLSYEDDSSVYYVVTEEELLDKYGDLSIEEAVEYHYDSIYGCITVGLYTEWDDKLYIHTVDVNKTLSFLQSNGENDIFECSISDVEKIEETNSEGSVIIAMKMFKDLLEIKDANELHEKLKDIYDEILKVNEVMFDKKEELNFKVTNGTGLMETFNNSYNFVLSIENIDEMKDVLQKLYNMYETLYCEMDFKGDSDEKNAAEDFLLRLIEEYEELSKLNDLNEIKKGISKIQEREEVNIRQLSTIYDKTMIAEKTEVVENNVETTKEDLPVLIKVSEMKEYFDKKIIGQEQAKIDVISSLFMNALSDDPRDRNACLLIGPTGSGKTLIAETIGEFLKIPVAIADTTQLTMPGYVGANIEDILSSLLAQTNGNVKEAEKSIVVFDEIDKKGSSSNGDVSGRGVLNTLLPFIQGTNYSVTYNNRKVNFNTSKLTIFATGAFANVAEAINKQSKSIGFNSQIIENKEDIVYPTIGIEDLAKYGSIPPELLGRFSTITQLQGHTKESLKQIIFSESSALIHEKNKLSKVGIELTWTDGFIDAVVDKAMELKTGARSIKNSLEKAILYARWYAIKSLGTYNKILLTKETVNDNLDCELYDNEGNVYNLKTGMDVIIRTEVPKLEEKGKQFVLTKN